MLSSNIAGRAPSSLSVPSMPVGRPRVKPAEAIDYEVTPSFVALLERFGCSLVITNYQSSTVMTFSSLGDGRPVQMFAPFRAAMGLAIDGDRLAIAGQTEIAVLSKIKKLAPGLPKFPGVFDGYLVRIDCHASSPLLASASLRAARLAR